MASFGTISITQPSAKTFNELGPNRYVDSTTVFNGPKSEFRFTPGRTSKDSTGVKKVTCAATRLHEADVVVNGVTVRRQCVVVVNISVQEGFTASIPDAMLTETSEVLTQARIDTLLREAS